MLFLHGHPLTMLVSASLLFALSFLLVGQHDNFRMNTSMVDMAPLIIWLL
jgi:hypothetical protein